MVKMRERVKIRLSPTQRHSHSHSPTPLPSPYLSTPPTLKILISTDNLVERCVFMNGTARFALSIDFQIWKNALKTFYSTETFS